VSVCIAYLLVIIVLLILYLKSNQFFKRSSEGYIRKPPFSPKTPFFALISLSIYKNREFLYI
jgi:hypothetical protein